MAAMNSFDYLRSARPLWLQRLVALHLAREVRMPCFALACALLTLCAAWGIERARLRDAQRTEMLYRERLESSERRAKATHLYYDRVAKLVSLDRLVRAIVASGDTEARRLAEIANALPARLSLTSIARAGSAIDLEGEAQDLRAVGAAVRALEHARTVRHPALTAVTAVSEKMRDKRVKYAIRAEAAP
jgi:Tfp pilus assembly protein PilN